MTNVKALTSAIETLSAMEGFPTEAIQKLENIKASYSKRANATRKPTATQVQNEGIKSTIAEILASAEAPMTVSEVVKALGGEYTSQKISALMNAMARDGLVAKTVDKRKSLFSV